MEIRIYFEGKSTLRSGFESFFAELRTAARIAGSTVEFIAAKDGPSVFRKANRTHPGAWNILLQDSEGPPPARREADVFWIVQLMEAWFLADRDALSLYYGDGFAQNAIGDTADVEQIPKLDVFDRLKRATRNTTKGEYSKVKHAPFLLDRLSSRRVQTRAAHCRELFELVRARLQAV